MTKFQLKNFLKAAYGIILVILQFFIISLHFFRWELIPQKQIIQASPFSNYLGILIIIVAFIIMLVAIKDFGRNLSPFPRPMKNSNLVTNGIYRFTRHPMYYSLIFISFGVFLTKLSIYYLFNASIRGPYNLNDNLSKLLFPKKKSGSFLFPKHNFISTLSLAPLEKVLLPIHLSVKAFFSFFNFIFASTYL